MKRYEQGSVGMRPDPEGSWCDYAEARAEIERLRKEVTKYKARNAEIERLRSELAEYTAAVQKRDAEIERLRGLLGDVQIIMDSHNNIVGNLNGEITRLRALLLEGLDHHDEYNWQQRVREALGD